MSTYRRFGRRVVPTFCLLLCLATSLSAQSGVWPPSAGAGVPNVASLPGTCSPLGPNYVVWLNTGTVGLYFCLTTNTYTQAGAGSAGTVTSAGLVGTANQITVTGASPITGSGSWTLTLPSVLTLPGTINKYTLTAPATGVTITIADGKTFTLNNSITFVGTDSTQMTFPTTSATIARTDAANTFTGHQTIEGVTSTGATGTGLLVFGSGPTIVTPTIASFTNATHTHQNAAGGGTLAEAALALTNITTNDVSTSAHGFAPKGTTGTTQFWRQDWTLATPGGSGTVTVVGAGSLTSTALVTGGGTTTVQTPSATATMDSSGNISTPGTMSSGVGSGVAGSFSMVNGTAPTVVANSVGWQAPTTVTTALSLQFPNANPSSNQFLLFPSPTSNVSAGAWAGFTAPVAVSGGNIGCATCITGSPTNHGVALGSATQANGYTAAGTANEPLLSGGASADPAYAPYTIPATIAAHQTLVATGTTAVVAKTIPDCTDSGGNHINYAQSTDAFSCGTSSSGGGGSTGTSVTSTTPVTVNTNTTSDQQLMELTLGAGYFNSANQPFLFDAAGVYTTQTAQTPTITLKVKLCTVSGCGSGTVVTLVSIVSTATLAAVVNNNWNLAVIGYTHTTGATGNLEIHGPLAVDLGALTTTADSIFVDTNTAASSNIDLTAALFVDFTIAYSTNAATANTFTQRSGGVMPFAATAAPVTSFSGDGALISNSSSTGAVTATLATAGAHKTWMNNTGSTAAAGYQSIGTADLPVALANQTSINGLGITASTGAITIPNGVTLTGPASSGTAAALNQANTFASAGTLDMSGATGATALKVPVIAGATAGADGVIDYDSTGKLTHVRTNGADSSVVAATTTSTTTTQVYHATAVAGVAAPSAIVAADIPASLRVRGISFSIGDPNGAALSTGVLYTDYVTVPFACTISAYNLLVDAGTITVKFLKVATGTAIPTVGSNSISTSGVSIASGTAIHSTTVTDFTTTTVTANDIMAMQITTVATAKFVNGVLECDQ